jgi:hypothetical protein
MEPIARIVYSKCRLSIIEKTKAKGDRGHVLKNDLILESTAFASIILI